MSVKIIHTNELIEIRGDFTSQNRVQIKTYLSDFVISNSSLNICLKNINSIDESAIDVLKFIKRKALTKQTSLFVFGKKHPLVNKVFESFNISHILKNDIK